VSSDRPDPLAATIARADVRVDATAFARTQLAVSGGRELPHVSVGEAGAAREDDRDLEVVEELGRGGMGVVLRARQHSIGRDVAIKRVNGNHEDSASALLYEARITGALEHPNIVPVHQVGRDREGLPVIVMKRIAGTTWSALLHRADHPRWDEVSGDRLRFHLETLIQICNAVAFAHAEGVVHRDIKPENVMIGEFGEVYLLDWGIAVRKDRQGTPNLAGTPAYMAPEMLALEPVDERTDVYLLGASLHEALTGRPRHPGTSIAEVLRSVAESPPVTLPSDVPEELVAIVNRATHRDRSMRFASVGELRRSLERYLVHRASTALVARANATLNALPDGAKLDELRVRFAESRFGFRSALEQWPENEAARSGMRRALAQMFDAELHHGNLDAAAALLADADELGDVEGQRARLEAARRRQKDDLARLREEARQGDAGVSARDRALASAKVGVLLLAAALTMGQLTRGGALELNYLVGVGFNALAFVIVTAAKPAIFRRVEPTRYNRAMIDVLQAFIAGTVALRAAAWYLHVQVLDELRLEAVATTIVHAVIALTVDRKLLPAAAIAGTFALASVLSRSFTLELVLLCQMGAFAFIIFSWYRRGAPTSE